MSSYDDSVSAPKKLRTALEALLDALDEHHARYALIGGLALVQHGRVRATDDIDVLLTVPQIALPGLIESLQARGFTADRNQVIREYRDDGMSAMLYGDVTVDLMRPVIPAYGRVLERATTMRIGDRDVRICTVEGLIVMKLVSMRAQDQLDIRELILLHGKRLDIACIRKELATFAPPGDPRYAKWESWLLEAGATGAA